MLSVWCTGLPVPFVLVGRLFNFHYCAMRASSQHSVSERIAPRGGRVHGIRNRSPQHAFPEVGGSLCVIQLLKKDTNSEGSQHFLPRAFTFGDFADPFRIWFQHHLRILTGADDSCGIPLVLFPSSIINIARTLFDTRGKRPVSFRDTFTMRPLGHYARGHAFRQNSECTHTFSNMRTSRCRYPQAHTTRSTRLLESSRNMRGRLES
ncbi:hypothetical protein OF83DRAFT_850960 [Amylostereum chailletii]|nr:hypothetical protein OF83DRAFT_850960 [Amylostereum chailletii]